MCIPRCWENRGVCVNEVVLVSDYIYRWGMGHSISGMSLCRPAL